MNIKKEIEKNQLKATNTKINEANEKAHESLTELTLLNSEIQGHEINNLVLSCILDFVESGNDVTLLKEKIKVIDTDIKAKHKEYLTKKDIYDKELETLKDLVNKEKGKDKLDSKIIGTDSNLAIYIE